MLTVVAGVRYAAGSTVGRDWIGPAAPANGVKRCAPVVSVMPYSLLSFDPVITALLHGSSAGGAMVVADVAALHLYGAHFSSMAAATHVVAASVTEFVTVPTDVLVLSVSAAAPLADADPHVAGQ